MRSSKVLMITMIFSSAFAWASPEFNRALKDSSFEEVEATTNYLLVVIENASKKPPVHPILNCDPTPEKAQAWMSGPLHELSDAKLEKESARYRANPKRFRERIKACAKTCTCQSFAALLDAVEDKMKSNPAHRSNRAVLAALAIKESSDKNLECAKSYQSFCGSQIAKYLKSED